MALVFAEVADTQDEWGKTRVKVWDVTCETSYVAGGTTITPANVAMRRIYGVKQIGGNAASKVLLFHFDVATTVGSALLICLFPTGGATTAPSTLADPKSTSGASTASAVNATTPDITPGQAKEVAATANLSTLIIRCMFFGN